MSEAEPIFQWIDRYGLPLVMFVITTGAWLLGKIRAEREVVRERQISDSKDAVIAALLADQKEQTTVMNRLAAGIEERNRIEREMRGRRT